MKGIHVFGSVLHAGYRADMRQPSRLSCFLSGFYHVPKPKFKPLFAVKADIRSTKMLQPVFEVCSSMNTARVKEKL